MSRLGWYVLNWTDGQNYQTSFYVNSEYKDRAIIGNGTGRYDLLQAQIGSVKSEADMTELMKKVRYTLTYDPYNCPFDPCSEQSGEGEEKHKDFGGILTMEMCADEKYSGEIYSRMEEYGAAERAKSLQQRRDEGIDWISVWQTTVNCNKRSLTTVFLEDDALTFDFAV